MAFNKCRRTPPPFPQPLLRSLQHCAWVTACGVGGCGNTLVFFPPCVRLLCTTACRCCSCTKTDVDLIFMSSKTKGARRLNFDQYLIALDKIGGWAGPCRAPGLAWGLFTGRGGTRSVPFPPPPSTFPTNPWCSPKEVPRRPQRRGVFPGGGPGGGARHPRDPGYGGPGRRRVFQAHW